MLKLPKRYDLIMTAQNVNEIGIRSTVFWHLGYYVGILQTRASLAASLASLLMACAFLAFSTKVCKKI